MQWIRLDTSIFRNHKIAALLEQPNGHRAFCAYIAGLCYAGEQNTNGFIPRHVVRFAAPRKSDVNLLVNLELWEETPGGYDVHDWDEYQFSNEENQRRSDRARAAAIARWSSNGHAPSIAPSIANGNAPGNAHTYIHTDSQTSLIPPQPK